MQPPILPEQTAYVVLCSLAAPALRDVLVRCEDPDQFATWGGAKRISYHLNEILALLEPTDLHGLPEVDAACVRLAEMLRLTQFDLVYDSHDMISMETQGLLAAVQDSALKLLAWLRRDRLEAWQLKPAPTDAASALGDLARLVLRHDLADLREEPLAQFLARRPRHGADLAWVVRASASAQRLLFAR